MAETLLATASQKQVWMTKYFQEYVRLSGYKSFMSNADLNKGGIILSRYELQKEAGKTINIPFIGRLKSSGVTGSDVLDGQEEELTNYNMPIAIDWRRNGVRVPKSQQFQTEINLLNAGRDALITWEAEKLRDDITEAFGGVIVDAAGTTVRAGASSPSQRNVWSAGNKDRLLFGLLNSNYSATWATALGNVGTASDKCSASLMSLGKRVAKLADPHIRPFRVDTDNGLREFFVAFHGARSFRDLKLDNAIIDSELYARPREGDRGMDRNPIFQDGDLFYDGILHREVPEIDPWASGHRGLQRPAAAAGRRAADLPVRRRLRRHRLGPGADPAHRLHQGLRFPPRRGHRGAARRQEDQLQRRAERHGDRSRRGGGVVRKRSFPAKGGPPRFDACAPSTPAGSPSPVNGGGFGNLTHSKGSSPMTVFNPAGGVPVARSVSAHGLKGTVKVAQAAVTLTSARPALKTIPSSSSNCRREPLCRRGSRWPAPTWIAPPRPCSPWTWATPPPPISSPRPPSPGWAASSRRRAAFRRNTRPTR